MIYNIFLFFLTPFSYKYFKYSLQLTLEQWELEMLTSFTHSLSLK